MKATNKKKWVFILPLLVMALAFVFATPAFAQDSEPPTAEQVNDCLLYTSWLCDIGDGCNGLYHLS